jgi:hypothetical protein
MGTEISQSEIAEGTKAGRFHANYVIDVYPFFYLYPSQFPDEYPLFHQFSSVVVVATKDCRIVINKGVQYQAHRKTSSRAAEAMGRA